MKQVIKKLLTPIVREIIQDVENERKITPEELKEIFKRCVSRIED